MAQPAVAAQEAQHASGDDALTAVMLLQTWCGCWQWKQLPLKIFAGQAPDAAAELHCDSSSATATDPSRIAFIQGQCLEWTRCPAAAELIGPDAVTVPPSRSLGGQGPEAVVDQTPIFDFLIPNYGPFM
jgi:hypothetical protein